jgi:hypothetical protein
MKLSLHNKEYLIIETNKQISVLTMEQDELKLPPIFNSLRKQTTFQLTLSLTTTNGAGMAF